MVKNSELIFYLGVFGIGFGCFWLGVTITIIAIVCGVLT